MTSKFTVQIASVKQSDDSEFSALCLAVSSSRTLAAAPVRRLINSRTKQIAGIMQFLFVFYLRALLLHRLIGCNREPVEPDGRRARSYNV